MSYFLNCDSLQLASGTLGDYVIEWRQGSISGLEVFVSGNAGNIDPDIEAYHPLVDEIVQGGTLYPIIRYAYINGDKYTAYYEEGAFYSPDFLTCLDPVVVDVLTCGDTNYVGDYDYYIVRDVGQGENSRSLKFDILNTTNYLAWGFDTEVIADGIKIYYCTLADPVGTLLDYLITGRNVVQDLAPVNYPINPIVIYNYSATVVKYVTDFSTIGYAAGDYLRIEIIGNIMDQSQTDTKWTIYLKCLENLDVMYDMYDMHNITDTPVISYDEDYCSYYLTYSTTDQITKPLGYLSSFFAKYFYIKYGGGAYANLAAGGSGYFVWITTSLSAGETNIGCAQLNDSITYTKNAGNITLTFTNTLDYDKAVSDITHIASNMYYANYLAATDKDVAYYSVITIMGYDGGVSCDNPGTNTAWYIHLSSSITYDPINKETLIFDFPVSAITNNMDVPFDSCDTTYDRADAMIAYMNGTIALANGTTYTAELRNNYIIGSLINVPSTIHTTTSTPYYYTYIPQIMINGLYDPLLFGWCLVGSQYNAYQIKDRITLTDPSTHESRLACWTLERSRFFTTYDCADLNTYDLIYEATTTTTTTTII